MKSKSLWTVVGIVLILAFFSRSGKAEELNGATETLLWGLSYHTHKEAGSTLNEKNWGIGLRYYFKEPLICNTFVEGDYIVRNSMRGEIWAAGFGLRCPFSPFRR